MNKETHFYERLGERRRRKDNDRKEKAVPIVPHGLDPENPARFNGAGIGHMLHNAIQTTCSTTRPSLDHGKLSLFLLMLPTSDN